MNSLLNTKGYENIMQAIIPAGGEATRLKPLSTGTPKCMLTIMDKPIIAYIAELLSDYGIKDITVTVNENTSLKELIKDLDFKDISFNYLYEKQFLGTAGGIKNADIKDDDILIIYGDIITNFNLKDMADFHKTHNAFVTLGAVGTNEETGILILKKEALSLFPENTPFDFYADFLPLVKAHNKKVITFYNDCCLYDIDTPSDYKNCSKNMLIIKTNSETGKKFSTKNVIIEDNSHLEIGATINPPVYIGKNVYIEAGAEIGAFSVIGENCRIYSNSHTEDSIIMANSLISDNTVLNSTIISENTKIKSGAKILENTVIGKDCIIGKNNIIKPDVNIWPGKTTADNEIIYENIINSKNSKNGLFTLNEITGDFEIDMSVFSLCTLGLIISNVFKRAKFLTATDGAPLSQLAKNALTAGIMEGGGTVTDTGYELISVFREALYMLSYDIGIYITSDKSRLRIKLTDSYGADISSSYQLKIESLFYKKKYFSSGVKNIRTLTTISNLSEYYFKKISAEIKKEDKKRILYFKKDSEKITDYLKELSRVSAITPVPLKFRNVKAGEICVSFINNGESVILYDETGERKTKEELFLIVALLLKDKNIKKIILPKELSLKNTIFSSFFTAFEADGSTYLKKLRKEGLTEQYRLCFDSIYFTASLMNYLSENGMLLKDLNLLL